MADDPYNLQRFVEAQQRCAEAEVPAYMAALAELRDGRKRGHWIWYVLPQLRGLGTSTNASLYGIGSLAEARAYLAHPSLGPRLRECVAAICRHRNRDAEQILGGDACKFRSCLTLFAAADGADPVFAAALNQFFEDGPDARTLQLLAEGR